MTNLVTLLIFITHKNIIHITGNDSYGVELEVTRWLGAFRSKFGDINIDRYDLGDKDELKGVGNMILMSGLFAEKRLFIFRGGRDRKSKTEGLEKMLIEKLSDIPEDHYLLFHNIGEKEEGLTSWLAKNADTRAINTLWDAKSWLARSDIDSSTLSLVLSTYRTAESARGKDELPNQLLGYDIAHTIEMASLYRASGKQLTESDIVGLCHGFAGDTLFALVDAIMAMDVRLSIAICKRISSIGRVDEWLGSLIGLLRNNLYIKYLHHHGASEFDIAAMMRIHPYVLKKGYTSRISYDILRKLYAKFVTTSVAYKRGLGLRDSELGRILSIELALLDLQK